MVESFDSVHYIGYLKRHWVQIAATAGIAVIAAFGISLLLPVRYTATARIVIQPPAGADVRTATAVSPIYLESLKTYEEFAESDSLFQRAAGQFQLAGGPIESLKRRVLRVGIVRNTRILEISATLGDARKAQALAKFLADATVELNRKSSSEGDSELLTGLEQQDRDIRASLQRTEQAWTAALSLEPTGGLEAQIEQSASQKSNLEEQIGETEVEVAGLEERVKSAASDRDSVKDLDNSRARLAEMRKQLADLNAEIANREKVLGARQAHRDQLSVDRDAAQAALASIEAHLRDARSERGYRGERLQVIDPGIIPQRPSSPNIPLNIVLALLAGLALPSGYFVIRASFQERASAWKPTEYHASIRTRQ